MNILIADDDKNLRKVLMSELSDEGFSDKMNHAVSGDMPF
jgi:DNA-binding response OmpR family regulator